MSSLFAICRMTFSVHLDLLTWKPVSACEAIEVQMLTHTMLSNCGRREGVRRSWQASNKLLCHKQRSKDIQVLAKGAASHFITTTATARLSRLRWQADSHRLIGGLPISTLRLSSRHALSQRLIYTQKAFSDMAPKRSQQKESASPAKKAKVESSNDENTKSALVKSLITDTLLGQTYCEELGIDLASGSNAVFQWLACSSMFGSRLSEV